MLEIKFKQLLNIETSLSWLVSVVVVDIITVRDPLIPEFNTEEYV